MGNLQRYVTFWDKTSRMYSHGETPAEIRDLYEQKRAEMNRKNIKPKCRAKVFESLDGIPQRIVEGPAF